MIFKIEFAIKNNTNIFIIRYIRYLLMYHLMKLYYWMLILVEIYHFCFTNTNTNYLLSFNLLYLYNFSIFIKVFLIKFVSSILLSAVKVIAESSAYTVFYIIIF